MGADRHAPQPVTWWRRRGTGGDEGMVTAFVIIFAVALLFVTGLALDGGRILTAKREARNIAQSAARAGAQALSEQAIRAGDDIILDAAGAHAAACSFLARTGHGCGGGNTVTTSGNEVIVTLSETVDLVMLGGVGPQSFTVEGRACVARGITGSEASAQC